MDSLTQIVLGAAMGEAVLGKKIGNRAMAWGALVGTIPDLDVIGNLFLDKIDAIAFHRGISHSIAFSVIATFVFAFLTYRLYQWKGKYVLEFGLASIFHLLIFAGVAGIVLMVVESWFGFFLVIFIGLLGLRRMVANYIENKSDYEAPSLREWQWMWFLGLITHPILDSFTVYGTQLFAPFSNYRVAFNNISVADPIYTLVFLVVGIIPVALYHRSSKTRRWFLYSGLFLSSLYMVFTFCNKVQVNKVMESTLATQEISYSKYMTNPSILNNVLWTGTVASDSLYYQGLYSLLDKEKNFKLISIPKNHHLIADAKPDDKVINILKWFSNNYYHILIRRDGKLQFNDMRYGTFRGDSYDEDDFIFRFVIEKGSDGYYSLIKEIAGGPDGNEKEMFGELWTRIKGI